MFTRASQFRGPPIFGCPQLLIQHTRSYLPYLEAVSSIRNLRMQLTIIKNILWK